MYGLSSSLRFLIESFIARIAGFENPALGLPFFIRFCGAAAPGLLDDLIRGSFDGSRGEINVYRNTRTQQKYDNKTALL